MPARPVVRTPPARTATIIPGFYRHYKGTLYRVLNTGWHSETEEELVFYHQADDIDRFFARPVQDFLETVVIADKPQPRFTFIEPKEFKGDTHG